MLGLERVQAVRANTISSGAMVKSGSRLAVGSRTGLIGMDGLLGLDMLAEQRLVMRFRGAGQTRINRSRMDPDGFLSAPRSRVNFAPLRHGDTPRLMMLSAVVRGQNRQRHRRYGSPGQLDQSLLAARAGLSP
ncbi:MAG: hypothetical protein HZY74_04865 [Brevundimonas sp.]|nr:MAG: hypothetical protein HZY74_04865 [Brevundimonas sp.]